MSVVLASMSDVIQHVRTPLALATLLLLVGAPIIREIAKRRGRPNADTKAIIRFGFAIGLAFGIMAIGATVYLSSFTREIRISGTVRDEKGAGMPFAAVRIAGRDGGVTDDSGNFAFTVPDSRADDRYTAEIFREGYELERVEMEGRYPKPISVSMRRVQVVLDRVIGLPNDMTIRHNLGVPQVEVAITFTNPLPRSTTISDIALTVINPAGTSIPMTMEGVAIVPGQLNPPLPIWKLEKGESATLGYSFFNANPAFMDLQRRVYLEMAPKLQSISNPDPSVVLLSDGLVKELRTFMESQFIWTPGMWSVRVTGTVEASRVEAVATFTISEKDVQHMRAIADHYSAALGVVPSWRFWQSSDVNPTANVALTRK